MSALPTVASSISDTARHPLSDGRRAAGRAIAEGASRPAPSAPIAFAGHVARAALEAAAIGSFVLAVLIWAEVLTGG